MIIKHYTQQQFNDACKAWVNNSHTISELADKVISFLSGRFCENQAVLVCVDGKPMAVIK